MLEQMPDVVLSKLLEKLDFQSILRLRKVSAHLLNFIDSTKPDLHLTGIHIYVHPVKIVLGLQDDFTKFAVKYERHATGCSVDYKYDMNKRVLLRKSNFMDVFSQDLGILWKLQTSILDDFCVDIEEGTAGYIIDGIRKVLHSTVCSSKTRNCAVSVSKEEQVSEMLSLIDSNVLESISIKNLKHEVTDEFELDEISKLDQWKNAKKAKISNCIVNDPLSKFSHFSEAEFQMRMISEKELRDLMENLRKSSSFQQFIVHFNYIDMNILENVFGNHFVDNGRGKYWYFPTKNNGKVLKIFVYCLIICFTSVEICSVPEGYLL